MKKNIKILSVVFFLSISYQSFSQDDQSKDAEAYSKANVAFTNFKVLGIDGNKFAKCVESVNFLDASKKHRLVIIDGEAFVDDGNNNDLAANDGILTSINVFPCPAGTKALSIGEYRPITNETIVHDNAFEHSNRIESETKESGFEISCKFIWVPCSSWPPPTQKICREFSWPSNGGFEVVECTIKWIFK